MGPYLMQTLRSASAILSWTAAAGGSLKYSSKICTIMSTMPAAVWYLFTVKVYSGSSIEKTGFTAGEPNASLRSVSSFVITPYEFISEPVAARVRTAPRGTASVHTTPFVKKSHTSFLYLTPAAIALEASITLPPPTASIKSTPSALQISIPSYTLFRRGLGLIPVSSTKETPAFLISFRTSSNIPFRLTLLCPVTTNTFFARASSSPLNAFIWPLPKWILVGMSYIKFSMRLLHY